MVVSVILLLCLIEKNGPIAIIMWLSPSTAFQRAFQMLPEDRASAKDDVHAPTSSYRAPTIRSLACSGVFGALEVLLYAFVLE